VRGNLQFFFQPIEGITDVDSGYYVMYRAMCIARARKPGEFDARLKQHFIDFLHEHLGENHIPG
jgi:hypothetical protein